MHATLRAVVVTTALMSFPAARSAALDCNRNGADDRLDLRPRIDVAAPVAVLIPESSAIRGPSARGALADLDADGTLEIVVAMRSRLLDATASVAILSYAAGSRFETRSIPHPEPWTSDLAVADLDRDGDLDILTVTPSSGSSPLAVFLNDGTGDLKCRCETTVADAYAVRVGDLDGDLWPDLAVRARESLWVHLAVGDGRFAPPEGIPLPAEPRSFVIADLDGDGTSDLAVTLPFHVRVHWGGPAFGIEQVLDIPVGSGPEGITAADLDGDGLTDLATANSLDQFPRNDNVSFLRNAGDRRFVVTRNVSVGREPESIVAADLDGDGGIDLAVTSFGDRTISILSGLESGSLDVTATLLSAGRSSTSLAAGDLDGDGAAELVQFHDAGVAVFFDRDADGIRDGRIVFPLTTADLGVPEFGDWDGDGDLDLAVHSSAPGQSGLVVFHNVGDGFRAEVVPAVAHSAGDLDSGDIDGDGDLDLVLAIRSPPHVAVYRNSGDGSFVQDAVLGDVGSGPVTPALADVDADGDLDLVVGSSRTTIVSVLLNRGGGAFGIRLAYNDHRGDGVVDGGPYFFEVLDLDADGLPEILYVDLGMNEIEILWNDGGAIRWLERLGREGADGYRTGDFDGDGLPDIFVFRRSEPCSNFIYLNNGDRTFRRAPTGALASCADGFEEAGDIDGDGIADLVVHERDDSVWFLLGDGSDGLTSGLRFELGPGVTRFVDLDGDGVRELVHLALGQGLAVFPVSVGPPSSADENGDGVPDECERVPFHRGDPSGDGRTNITDVVFLLDALFRRGPPPGCRESADADNDGRVNVHDAVTLLRYLFVAGAPPAPPGPPPAPCGLDPDLHDGTGDLGCEGYDGCAAR